MCDWLRVCVHLCLCVWCVRFVCVCFRLVCVPSIPVQILSSLFNYVNVRSFLSVLCCVCCGSLWCVVLRCGVVCCVVLVCVVDLLCCVIAG